MSSVGLLGGTFDPIHYGHLAIAESAREALGLDCVLFVPAAIQPLKPGRPVTDAPHRLAMVQLAVADNPAFSASAVEIDRPGPSYSVDTVARLLDDARAAGSGQELVFIVSAEAVRDLPAWREPRRLLELCRLAVVPRADVDPPPRSWFAEQFPGQEDRFLVVDGPHIRISGTEIRDLASRGRSIRYLVPPTVERYIADHRIYSSDVWRKNRS